jgi:hypothetical protein
MDQAALDQLVADALKTAIEENGYDDLKEMAPSEVAVDLLDHDDGIYKFFFAINPVHVLEEVLASIEKSVVKFREANS